MNTVRISFLKFHDLCNMIKGQPSILMDKDWLREHLKCSVKVDYLVQGGLSGDIITLQFDNEQDCIWFKLKHL